MDSPRDSASHAAVYAVYSIKTSNIPESFSLPSTLDNLLERQVPVHTFDKEIEYIAKFEHLLPNPEPEPVPDQPDAATKADNCAVQEGSKSIEKDTSPVAAAGGEMAASACAGGAVTQSPESTPANPPDSLNPAAAPSVAALDTASISTAAVGTTVTDAAPAAVTQGTVVGGNEATTRAGVAEAPTATTVIASSSNGSLPSLLQPKEVPPPKPPKMDERTLHDSLIADMMAETSQPYDVCYFYLESQKWDVRGALQLMQLMMDGSPRNSAARVSQLKNASPAASAATSAAPAVSRDEHIKTMGEKTNLDREVCYFYLDMVNWDVDAAIAMYNNTN